MSIKQMSMVWQLDLPHVEQSILLVMADHSNDDGRNAYPSVALVAWKTNMSERTVQRVLRKLERDRLIEPESDRRGGRPPKDGRRPTSTVYRLTLENGKRKPPLERVKGDTRSPFPRKKRVSDSRPFRGKRVTAEVEKGDRERTKRVTQLCHPNHPRNHPEPSPSASAPRADAVLVGKSGRKLTGWKAAGFWRFWDGFGWKHGRAEAVDAWLDIPDLGEALIDTICVAAKAEARRRRDIERRGGRWPWAEHWLRARRWEDEALRPPARAAPVGNGQTEDEATRKRRARAEVEAYNARMRAIGHPEMEIINPETGERRGPGTETK